jgi:hypothetical protein
VFYCFHEFLEAARKLALNGTEWFEFYRDTLRGHVRSAWDLLSTEVNEVDRTEDNFRARHLGRSSRQLSTRQRIEP